MKAIDMFKRACILLFYIACFPSHGQTVNLRCVGESVSSGINRPKNIKLVEIFYELSPNLIVWHEGTDTTTYKRDDLPKYTPNSDHYGSYKFTNESFSYVQYYDSKVLWPIEFYETFEINRKTGYWKAHKAWDSKYPNRDPWSYSIIGECEPWSGKRKF